MASDVSSYHLWSNEQLIHQEVSHRRAIASYFTGLTLTAATGVATFGVAVPVVVPIAGFKAYKIHSHHKKLKAIRNELTSRSLSPNEKKKRDILIPVTTTAAIYLASMGIADVFDVIPDAIQAVIHEPIREGLSLTDELTFTAGNKYQAFLVAEVAEAGLKGRMDKTNHSNAAQVNHSLHKQ